MNERPLKNEQLVKSLIIDAFKEGGYLNSHERALSQYETDVIEEWGNGLSREEWIKWTKEGKMPCMPIKDHMADWFDEATRNMPPVELSANFQSPFYILFTGYLKQQYRGGNSQFKIMFKSPKQFIIKPMSGLGDSVEFTL
jgi:hypothetical protein